MAAASKDTDSKGSSATPPTTSILTVLDSVSEADLATVRTEITTVERRLAGLRSLETVIDVALNGPPVRKKGGPKPKRSSQDDDGDDAPAVLERHREIANLLLSGPLRVAQIAEKLRVTPTSVYPYITRDWFAKNATGEVYITATGRAGVTGKKIVS